MGKENLISLENSLAAETKKAQDAAIKLMDALVADAKGREGMYFLKVGSASPDGSFERDTRALILLSPVDIRGQKAHVVITREGQKLLLDKEREIQRRLAVDLSRFTEEELVEKEGFRGERRGQWTMESLMLVTEPIGFFSPNSEDPSDPFKGIPIDLVKRAINESSANPVMGEREKELEKSVVLAQRKTVILKDLTAHVANQPGTPPTK